MRARQPDIAGTVERDSVNLGYEVFGDSDQTILLLPTWTIIHSRFWKFQVPYLARYYRVITYDGPGNGRSDRSTDPARYSADAYAADAVAVLDACGVEEAVVVGLSLGGQYGARLASLRPDLVSALVLIGPALPLAPPAEERSSIAEGFEAPYPEDPQGWDKYNAAYWRDHYEDFAQFFFEQVFSEPHSNKAIEDSVGWALETGPDVLLAEAARPAMADDGSFGSIESAVAANRSWTKLLESLSCPVLVVHGSGDRIQPYQAGAEAATLTGGALATLEGSGHIPNVRDPIRFNLMLRDFVEGVAS